MKQHFVSLAMFVLLLANAALGQQVTQKEYMYRVQPTRPAMLTKGPTAVEQAAISEHFTRLAELTKEGVVIIAGRTLNTDKSSFGIIIFRASSEEAAREIMNGDPAVKKGVMKATLFPFHTALMEGRPVQ
jgi:uncharacterized protein